MSGGVEYTLSGDSREVVNALKKIGDQVDRTEKRIDKMSKKGAAGGKEAATGFEKAAKGASKMAGAIAGAIGVGGAMATAIAAIRSEFQQTIRVAEEARNAQTGFAGALENLALNFTADKTVGAGQVAGRIGDIADATGATRGGIASALSTALSAKGSLTNDVAFNAVEQAFRLTPGDAGAATTLSSRALDIAKAEGRTDVDAILGQLVQAQGVARVTNLQKLGSTAVPATASVIAAGGTAEEGLELFSALTGLASDEEGNQSSTALISLVEQLKGFEAVAGEGSPLKQIQKLQANPALAAEFLGGASFEKKLQTPITRLLTGDAGALAELRAAQAGISGPRGGLAAAAFEGKVAQRQAVTGGPILAAERASQANLEGGDIADTAGGIRAQVRKVLVDTFAKVDVAGSDFLEEGIALRRFDFLTGSGGSAAVESGKKLLGIAAAGGPTGNLTAKDREIVERQIAVLDRLANSLEGAPVQKRPAAAALGN